MSGMQWSWGARGLLAGAAKGNLSTATCLASGMGYAAAWFVEYRLAGLLAPPWHVVVQAGVHVWVVAPSWAEACVAEARRAMVRPRGGGDLQE